MGKRLSHLSRRESILSFIVVLTFVIGIIQIVPYATNASMQQETGNATEVSVETHDDVSMFEELENQDPIGTHAIALDAPVYDYVDTHYYDGYGGTTNFANMQSSSSSYATLTEAPTSTTTIDFENYWYPWMSENPSSTQWGEVEVDDEKKFEFSEDGGQGSLGSNYARMPDELFGANSGGIESPTYDLSDADYFVFSCYIYDYGLAHSDEMQVFFKDRYGNYDYKFYWDQCGDPVDRWRYKELTVDDPQYLFDGFRVKYVARNIHWLQETGVDDHRIVAYGSNQLEQRFQFTNINYNEYRFEYLEIDFFLPTTESLIIECWSGTAWVQVVKNPHQDCRRCISIHT